jgi:hypothetical protein
LKSRKENINQKVVEKPADSKADNLLKNPCQKSVVTQFPDLSPGYQQQNPPKNHLSTSKITIS